VLPNATAISPEQKSALMAWVRGGGKLLLTYEAGTLDHDGTPSEDPLLAEAGVTLLEGDVRIEGGPDVPIRQVGAQAETEVAVEAEGAPLLTRRGVEDGEVWYYPAKAGKLAFEERQLPAKYNRGGGYTPPEAAQMVAELSEVAATVLGEAPRFVIDAPTGLLAWVYEAEHDGRPARAIHLLNCTGRDYVEGHPIEFDHENPPPMPPLPAMVMQLPGEVGQAVLATPEREGAQALEMREEDGVTMVTIPAESFETYGVVWAYDE
jgi:hypothetical protein